jgi:exosortase/archaeosortase family protein
MKIHIPESPSPTRIAVEWFIIVLFAMGLFLFFTSASYMKIDAISIWILTCLVILYLSRKSVKYLTQRQRAMVVIAGVLICFISFLRIPLGFGHPDYSIGDFSIFLSGLGLIIFGLLGLESFILPVLIPLVAVIGFDIYDLFIRHLDWLTAPLVPFVVFLDVLLLHLTGIPALSQGSIISFNSLSGIPIYLEIGSDCTGIWSLGTFTIATIIVLIGFPQAISRKGLFYILIGYLGAYAANILRIFVISLSGYLYGPSGVIEHVHIYIGWIIFTLWMLIFWYLFFTRYLKISFSATK